MYWAHCKHCQDHFETKKGACPGCRSEDTMSVDSGAENGCAECIELYRVELELKRPRELVTANERAELIRTLRWAIATLRALDVAASDPDLQTAMATLRKAEDRR